MTETATYTTSTTSPTRGLRLHVFDWGDGKRDTTGMVESGDTVAGSHVWDSLGTFPVRAKAKDEKGRWGEWSDTLNVTLDSGFRGRF